MRATSRCAMLVITISGGLVAPLTAHAEVRHYDIDPGGLYTYKPSPFVGIPGCSPSDYECGFGIDGTFSIDYDVDADTASLINMDLILTGNEGIQNNPPNIELVTAERVEQWLEERLFFELSVTLPGDLYQDQTFSGLKLLDLLNGTVHLTGGYDLTFVDGNGVFFNLSVTQIPEPAAVTLASSALLLAWLASRSRGQLKDDL